MDYVALRSELQNDPTGLGYADLIAAGNDAGIATLLNTRNIAGRRLLKLWELKLHCIKVGNWPKIRAAAAITPGSEGEAQLQAVAQTVLDYVNDTRFENIDIDDAASQTMLAVLVAGGVLTEAESAAIVALAATALSRAEQLGLVESGINVTEADVSAALQR